MKKILVLFITIGMIFTVSLANEIDITFNGEKLNSDVAPVKISNRVMVPVRVISEKAGATVDFNYQTNEITLTSSNAVVKLTVNNNKAYINGKEKILDVPATEINNRTLVPIRFVGESLGLNIDWVNETVVITTKSSTIANDEGKNDNEVIEMSKKVLDIYLQASQNEDIRQYIKQSGTTNEEIKEACLQAYGGSLEKIKANVRQEQNNVVDSELLEFSLFIAAVKDIQLSDSVNILGDHNTVKNGQVPTLKAGQWLNGNSRFITKVTFVDNYKSNGTEPYWIIDENNEGTIKCYAVGRELIISGNGTGKIMANENSSEMFGKLNWTNLKEINGIELLDTSNVNNMGAMFENCRELKSLDLSNWNTSNVINMSHMFASCEKIEKLDVSKWDVSKVINMKAMFLNCKSLLQKLDISNWNINEDTDIEFMLENYLR